MLKNAIERPQ